MPNQFKVTINFDIEKEFADLEKLLYVGLSDLAQSARDEWEMKARDSLHTTQDRYIDALYTDRVSDDFHKIGLRPAQGPTDTGRWLVNAIEGGIGSFSGHVKQTLSLSNPKSRLYSKYAKRANQPKQPPHYVPFMDVPNFGGRAGPKNPVVGSSPVKSYRRLWKGNQEGFKHPGFKPVGKGGLDRPLREFVVEHIEKEIESIFGPILSDAGFTEV
jgi:hypothetical protein